MPPDASLGRAAKKWRSAPLGQLAGPELAGELVEHAIDDARLIASKEGVGAIDIFADDHARRHVAQLQQLEGARAQDGAHDGIDAIQAPALGGLSIDHRIADAL